MSNSGHGFHARFDEYSRYLSENPILDKVPDDAGISILRAESDASLAEERAVQRVSQQGHPESWAHIGIVYQDEYLAILRDPVKFPDGQFGTYIRVLQQQENNPGVAILPLCKGKIVLIEHYRHATQGWHWEVPRGFGESADSEQNARSEMREELLAECEKLEPLGFVHTNSGLLSERVHLFYAEISKFSRGEKKEPIRSIQSFCVDEVVAKLASGEITDSFTMAAVSLAKWKGMC